MAPYYPAFLDVKDRLCVIIGAGQIAEGKIASLLECGAQIKIISSEVTAEVQGMTDAGILSLEKREYREGDLEGAFVAIAATAILQQMAGSRFGRRIWPKAVEYSHKR